MKNTLEERINSCQLCDLFKTRNKTVPGEGPLDAVAYKIITGESIKIKNEHGSIKKMKDFYACPTFHPNGIRYVKGGRKTIIEDIRKSFEEIGLKSYSGEKGEKGTGKLFILGQCGNAIAEAIKSTDVLSIE